MIRRLIQEEEGQAAVEYALIAVSLVVALYAVATGLTKIQAGLYQTQHQALQQWQSP